MIYRAVFLIFVFALSALADDQEFALPQKWIKVRVTVSAPDSMKRETLSFLTRELRALGDVEVVDTAPDYQIGSSRWKLRLVPALCLPAMLYPPLLPRRLISPC